MATYKYVRNLKQIVIQTVYEEFDTTDQDLWDKLLENASDYADEDELENFPIDASDELALWFKLFSYLNEGEFTNSLADDWVSDRKGFTEITDSLEDSEGNEIFISNE